METTVDIIRRRAATVVKAACEDEVGVYRMIKQLVATTIKEYRGRFVHELIQNGFDAHPDGSGDGKIAVHFQDEEGEHGVLYVANGGRPLSESNFLRMASLGDSDKPIGVGIGNKGVGFKSVFQICDAPEVYSASGPDDPGFAGFSFRFGTPTDLENHIASDDPLREKLESELSLSLLTVPLSDPPSEVAEFRSQGFVTVLRLPASSERAADEIRDRIDRLLNSRSPIMLFLDRLETISIKSSSASEPTVLTRDEKLAGEFKQIVLNEDENFLLFDAVVPHDDLLAALRDAVEEGALDEKWLSWSSEASVSVAVGDGHEIADPAAFTFLPMGDAASSPLGGHVNAPFITDFARLGVDPEQPVNRLMLRRIAVLCVEAAGRLIERRRDAGAVIDLLAWDLDSSEPIANAVDRVHGVGVGEFMQLPTMSSQDWSRLDGLSDWSTFDCEVLSAARLVRSASARLIDISQVDSARLERLTQNLAKDGSLLPAASLAADWVERVASSLVDESATLAMWSAFYDDLPRIFSKGEALHGKQILLLDSGGLVPADQPATLTGGSRVARRGQRAVFFAPKSAGTEDDDAVDSDIDISPPPALARRIAFLHGDLDWYDGAQQTPGRKFLQDNRLARQFRTASLLNHLAQLMSSDPSDAVKRDALDFAFRLFASNPTKHSKELADVGLAVPTIMGSWVKASRAHFSRGWQVPGAADLSDLVAGAPEQSSELARIANRLVVEPVLLGGEKADESKWRTFLAVLGVTGALPINQALDSRRMYGLSLRGENIAGAGAPDAVPRGVVEQWITGITSTGNTHHPETYFTTQDPIYWFAGQHEVGSLSARLRNAYARLIILTTPLLEAAHKESTWARDRSGGWTTSVETPLWSFLTVAEWVPVVGPNQTALGLFPPCESWYVGAEDNMAAAYSPLIDSRLRTLMDSTQVGDTPWSNLGFLDWTDPVDAASLVNHLTALFGGGDIPETASEHFRMSLASAWSSVGDTEVETRPTLDDVLLVETQGQLGLIAKDDAEGRIFVAGTHDQSVTARLVRELGWPTVAVESSEPARLNEVAETLRTFWHEDVQVTSDWNLDVLADGMPWTASETSPRLVDEIHWLPFLIAACMRFPRSTGMRIGKRLGAVLDEVGRIHVVSVGTVAVASAGGDQPLPKRLHGVLPMAGDIPTVLAEGHRNPITWEQFEVLGQGVLELLGQERFKAELSLTIRDLGSGPDQPIGRPTNAELAAVLQVSERQIAEIESVVFGAVGGIVARLRHVGPAIWGDAALKPFDEERSATYSRDDLLDVLTDLSGEEAGAKAILDAATDTPNADALRRRLGVALETYNSMLSRYFPSVPLVNNTVSQTEEFDLRRRQRREELLDWARAIRIERFDAGEIQNDWLEIRDLAFLEPDPEWATTADEVAQDLLDARIDAGMIAKLGPNPGGSVVVPNFETVQAANGRQLRTRLTDAHRVVTAWCSREGVDAPANWDADELDVELRQLLAAIGALDFRELSDDDVAAWLSSAGVWPKGMGLSIAPEAHGLADDELRTQEKADADAKAEKARAARRVQFQGVDVDLDASLSGLVDLVSQFLESEPVSLNSAYRASALGEIVDTKSRGRANGGGGGGGVVRNRLSNEQSGAIGLVGELVAFQWLKNRDPSGLVDGSCWRSGNSRFAIEGALGDDGLGFDFEVPRRGGSVMYEVKATTADAGMIELGETEVRCAQQFSRSERWRLLIVEHVLSDAPKVHMLPNPFRSDSRSFFSFVGNSVRLRFKLD